MEADGEERDGGEHVDEALQGCSVVGTWALGPGGARGAVAGLVVTASHNPASDNGIKVYGRGGAQIVPPADAEIAALSARVAEEVCGRPGSFVGGNAALDERFYALYYDVDAVSVGPRGANLHGADEHTTVTSLVETATTIARIAIEYCGVDD